MYYLKKALVNLLLLGGISFSINATAAPGNSFQITDFRFGMEDPSFGTWQTSGGATPIDPAQYGVLVEGTYQGANVTNELVNFNFFNQETFVYTAFKNLGSTNTAVGTITGGPEPTLDLVTLTADMSSWFATWNGTEFNQGNNTTHAACTGSSPSPNAASLSDIATVTDNFDGSYRISWNSCITGGAFNGKVGFWQLDVTCTTCPPSQLGFVEILTASQNGGSNTHTATVGGGNIVITSSFGALPAVGINVNWKATDPSITDIDTDVGTFTFDPSGLEAGIYVFTAAYKDANTTPETKGAGEIIIRLRDSVVGDVADNNGNRIENKDDATLASNQLQSELGADKTTYALTASAGSLRVGKTAFCAGKAARITNAELRANASASCGTTLNSSDDLVKAVGIGGYYDFEVMGINLGETVDVVIPLTESIPASAVYRKYSESIGWATFITEGGDKLSSAKSSSAGVCPEPTSGLYSAGLTAGDDCARLSITDGGPNDADNSANGLIKDPGGVAQVNSGTEANLAGGSSVWLLITAFFVLIGFRKGYR